MSLLKTGDNSFLSIVTLEALASEDNNENSGNNKCLCEQSATESVNDSKTEVTYSFSCDPSASKQTCKVGEEAWTIDSSGGCDRITKNTVKEKEDCK